LLRELLDAKRSRKSEQLSADQLALFPESGVKTGISDLNRLQSVNLPEDAIGQILQ
jgi:hypothetical protein